MTDDNNDGRISLSRRKALAGIGTIGAAGALGAFGTYAQFTDTEEGAVTFTAGGIDGMVEGGARYNGDVVDELADFSIEESPTGIGLDVTLDDVKPGDYGCFSFKINVTNNPAWVAACLGYTNDVDGESFEPEVDADPHVGSTGYTGQTPGEGELAESILTIPFYKPPNSNPSGIWDPCVFFDEEVDDFDHTNYQGSGAVGTPTQFWSNSEQGLVPATLAEASQYTMINSATWGDDGNVQTYDLGDSIAVDQGCYFLNGDATTDENQQGAAPLQPGTDLYVGWDWHLPFDTGNIAQGDEITLQLGFVFGQTRHTESAQLSNVFSPGSNT